MVCASAILMRRVVSPVHFAGMGMPFNSRLFLLTGVFYLTLVSGGVLLFGSDGLVNDLVKLGIAVVALALILRASPSREAYGLVFKFILFFSVPLLFSSYFARNVDYSLSKIDSAILGTSLSFLLAAATIRRYGFLEFLREFLLVGLVILFFTVIYKILFGFSDRSVRFFLNGPIVFGWLMGLMGVVALSLWQKTKLRRYLLFVAIFFVAVVWTQSKGPLLAFLVVGVFVFLIQMRVRQRLWTIAFLGLLVLGASQLNLSEIFAETRFAAIERILKNSTSDADFGSVDVRARMYDDALGLADRYPVTGVGVGNWQALTNSDYLYPHNQHLEILAELGVFYFFAYAVLVLYAFAVGGGVIRSIIVFLMVAASFSGDLSYTRYIFLFSLLGIYLRTADDESAVISRSWS